MSTDLHTRVSELEQHVQRKIFAREGTDGWINFIQDCIQERLLEEREFSHEVVANALAILRNEILDAAKEAIEKAVTRCVRGTYNPQSAYSANDIVALDGGTFIARKDNPGPCPGGGWQLMAKQGQRGIAGPKGERGPAGKTIEGWIIDRSTYRIKIRLRHRPMRRLHRAHGRRGHTLVLGAGERGGRQADHHDRGACPAAR